MKQRELVRYTLTVLLCSGAVMAGVTGAYRGIFVRGEALCAAEIAQGKMTGEENRVELLARFLYAELPQGTYLDRISLAAVVLNRADSTEYPDTVMGVITQNGAFASAADGRIFGAVDTEDAQYLQCRSAAALAVSGMDPTDGALDFSSFCSR